MKAESRNGLVALMVLTLYLYTSQAQLTPEFYSSTCPDLLTIVQGEMQTAVASDQRLPASLLRVFFHDCFVNGCEGSVLLKDNETFQGEQSAPQNRALRGLDVIDSIKLRVEQQCPGIVSCADILALATRDGIALSQGPSWTVDLGRRDATTANRASAVNNLPFSSSNLPALVANFARQGMTLEDLVVLSGAHTLGFAPCIAYRSRIYNDANIDPEYAASLQANCPRERGVNDSFLSPIDVSTWPTFDNAYYTNLVSFKGLLHSDQELFNNNSADAIVRRYNADSSAFFTDFASAMMRLGALRPLTGSEGEIRQNCGRVN